MQVLAHCIDMDYMSTTHKRGKCIIPPCLLNEFERTLGRVRDDLVNIASGVLDMMCVGYFNGSPKWHCNAGAASLCPCVMGGCTGAAGHGLFPGSTRSGCHGHLLMQALQRKCSLKLDITYTLHIMYWKVGTGFSPYDMFSTCKH